MTHKLFCLPYAGGGASFYRAWPDSGPRGPEVCPVQLPGREERFAEPLHESIDQAADDVVRRITPAVGQGDAVSLFGHSFGAVLAFEVARRLSGLLPVAHLVVSGSADPLTPLPREAVDLDDDQFVARVEQLAGYTHPALSDPELRDLVLPAMRRDVALHESYVVGDRTPIAAPITVVRGADDHIVSAADCAGWAQLTSAHHEYVELPGGHMYLVDDPARLLDLLGRVAVGSRL
ncbi:thioesterase II family protein [Actinokineospora sp. G85]|uniref:thioesterase II family protein n=1 Tax=Actinokineospora sp. G85 TaxID=3406626 RepID=UPI003C7607C0